MARTTVPLTAARQRVATGRCVITVIRSGRYNFNDTNSDTAASLSYYKAGEQIVQTETKDTYALSPSGDGLIIVDQEGN
ncbi:hypothetical protein [Vibrio phage VP16T]|nr:hypothetical protein [Vibrio phage VP16T]